MFTVSQVRFQNVLHGQTSSYSTCNHRGPWATGDTTGNIWNNTTSSTILSHCFLPLLHKCILMRRHGLMPMHSTGFCAKFAGVRRTVPSNIYHTCFILYHARSPASPDGLNFVLQAGFNRILLLS